MVIVSTSGATRVLIVAALCLMGCAGSRPRLYVNPQADMSYYKKVAVLPFDNLAGDRYAGDRVTRSFVTEMIIADRYQLVEPADFWVVLVRMAATPSAQGVYDPKKLKEAATELGATGIIRGAVTEYEMQRSGGTDRPVLAFDVELTDVATGNVVWRASLAKRGHGRVPILGGPGERSLGKLTETACRELVARLQAEAL